LEVIAALSTYSPALSLVPLEEQAASTMGPARARASGIHKILFILAFPLG
jgi:hypothetical protein